VVHGLRTLVGQRIVGIACSHEDVNDQDELRFRIDRQGGLSAASAAGRVR
jgi:hypothetical protein